MAANSEFDLVQRLMHGIDPNVHVHQAYEDDMTHLNELPDNVIIGRPNPHKRIREEHGHEDYGAPEPVNKKQKKRGRPPKRKQQARPVLSPPTSYASSLASFPISAHEEAILAEEAALRAEEEADEDEEKKENASSASAAAESAARGSQMETNAFKAKSRDDDRYELKGMFDEEDYFTDQDDTAEEVILDDTGAEVLAKENGDVDNGVAAIFGVDEKDDVKCIKIKKSKRPEKKFCFACDIASADVKGVRSHKRNVMDSFVEHCKNSGMGLDHLARALYSHYKMHIQTPLNLPEWGVQTIIQHYLDHAPDEYFVNRREVRTLGRVMRKIERTELLTLDTHTGISKVNAGALRWWISCATLRHKTVEYGNAHVHK
jgi:hypothetical protein